MIPKPKNIIIFATIGIIFILIYVFFVRKTPDTATLVSSSEQPISTLPETSALGADSLIAKDFLALLLSVKTIKLDDTIFSDIAFKSLHDSSIILLPDGTEGRPNPFAPLGTDVLTVPVDTKTAPNPGTGLPTPP